MDMFKGIGIPVNDPFENFRKNRSQGYVSRMREKAETAIASISNVAAKEELM